MSTIPFEETEQVPDKASTAPICTEGDAVTDDGPLIIEASN